MVAGQQNKPSANKQRKPDRTSLLINWRRAAFKTASEIVSEKHASCCFAAMKLDRLVKMQMKWRRGKETDRLTEKQRGGEREKKAVQNGSSGKTKGNSTVSFVGRKSHVMMKRLPCR